MILCLQDGPIGPSNRWYKLGFEDLWIEKVEDIELQIFSAPCYLATKFEAFNDRGGNYRTSYDFEDIIYVLDNRTSIVTEIENTHVKIKDFLRLEIKKILESPYTEEIISAHIHPLMLDERYPIMIKKMTAIVEN